MTVRPPELAVETSGPCVAGVVLVVLDGGDVELVLEIDPLVSGDRSVVVDPVPDVVEVPCGDVEPVLEVGPLVPGSLVVDPVSEVDVPEVLGGDGREVVVEWFAGVPDDVLVWPPEQAAASTTHGRHQHGTRQQPRPPNHSHNAYSHPVVHEDQQHQGEHRETL